MDSFISRLIAPSRDHPKEGEAAGAPHSSIGLAAVSSTLGTDSPHKPTQAARSQRCSGCNKEFIKLIRASHTCRSCMQAICDPCGRTRIKLTTQAQRERVCLKCVNRYKKQGFDVNNELKPWGRPGVHQDGVSPSAGPRAGSAAPRADRADTQAVALAARAPHAGQDNRRNRALSVPMAVQAPVPVAVVQAAVQAAVPGGCRHVHLRPPVNENYDQELNLLMLPWTATEAAKGPDVPCLHCEQQLFHSDPARDSAGEVYARREFLDAVRDMRAAGAGGGYELLVQQGPVTLFKRTSTEDGISGLAQREHGRIDLRAEVRVAVPVEFAYRWALHHTAQGPPHHANGQGDLFPLRDALHSDFVQVREPEQELSVHIAAWEMQGVRRCVLFRHAHVGVLPPAGALGSTPDHCPTIVLEDRTGHPTLARAAKGVNMGLSFRMLFEPVMPSGESAPETSDGTAATLVTALISCDSLTVFGTIARDRSSEQLLVTLQEFISTMEAAHSSNGGQHPCAHDSPAASYCGTDGTPGLCSPPTPSQLIFSPGSPPPSMLKLPLGADSTGAETGAVAMGGYSGGLAKGPDGVAPSYEPSDRQGEDSDVETVDPEVAQMTPQQMAIELTRYRRSVGQLGSRMRPVHKVLRTPAARSTQSFTQPSAGLLDGSLVDLGAMVPHGAGAGANPWEEQMQLHRQQVETDRQQSELRQLRQTISSVTAENRRLQAGYRYIGLLPNPDENMKRLYEESILKYEAPKRMENEQLASLAGGNDGIRFAESVLNVRDDTEVLEYMFMLVHALRYTFPPPPPKVEPRPPALAPLRGSVLPPPRARSNSPPRRRSTSADRGIPREPSEFSLQGLLSSIMNFPTPPEQRGRGPPPQDIAYTPPPVLPMITHWHSAPTEGVAPVAVKVEEGTQPDKHLAPVVQEADAAAVGEGEGITEVIQQPEPAKEHIEQPEPAKKHIQQPEPAKEHIDQPDPAEEHIEQPDPAEAATELRESARPNPLVSFHTSSERGYLDRQRSYSDPNAGQRSGRQSSIFPIDSRQETIHDNFGDEEGHGETGSDAGTEPDSRAGVRNVEKIFPPVASKPASSDGSSSDDGTVSLAHLPELAQKLIEIACRDTKVATYAFWYLKVAMEDTKWGDQYRALFDTFMLKLGQDRASWAVMLNAAHNYISSVSRAHHLARTKATTGKAQEMTGIMKQLLRQERLDRVALSGGPLTTSFITLPLDPSVNVEGIEVTTTYMFKSAMQPCVIEFRLAGSDAAARRGSTEYPVIGASETTPVPAFGGSSETSAMSTPGEPADEGGPSTPSVQRRNGELPKDPKLWDQLAALGATSSDVTSYLAIFKDADDLRPDQLATHMISIMDRALKDRGWDLHLRPYRILVTGTESGMVEFVRGAVPISAILAKHNNSVLEFLRVHNSDPEGPCQMKEDTFRRYINSAAASSVATYLLGVGDRHLDNIMLTPDGRLIHIDFSYLFGRDPKLGSPPFRLSSQMVDAMGGSGSAGFACFVSVSTKIYLSLRSSASMLLACLGLMADERNHEENMRDMKFFQDRFRLDLTQSEAMAHWKSIIEESIHSLAPKFLEKFHQLAVQFR